MEKNWLIVSIPDYCFFNNLEYEKTEMRENIILSHEDFNNSLKDHISKTASKVDIDITANAVYFIMKQHCLTSCDSTTYVDIINIVSEVLDDLIDGYGWKQMEVHACACKLNTLLKKCT